VSDKMPESMDEEAVREWVWELAGRGEGHLARAVLALVEAERTKEREACRSQTEAKVREAQRLTVADLADRNGGLDISECDADVRAEIEEAHEAIVARVLGRDGGAR
jgi:hypothetical protein